MLHTMKSKLALFSVITFISIVICVSLSYFIAVREIKSVMEADINSVADSLENTLNYIAEIKTDAHKDESFKKSLCAVKIGKSGYPFMLDEQGTLAVHPKEEGKNLAGLKHIDFIRSHKEGGIYEYTAKTTGQDKLVAFRYIPKWNLWVVPGVNKADYFDTLKTAFIKWNLIFVVTCIAILAFISAWITHSVTAPLKKMTLLLRDMAEGDGNLSNRLDESSKSEIGEAGRWFNRFVEKLAGIIAEVEKDAAEVSATAGRFSVSSGKMASAATEVSSQIFTVASSSEEMTATATEIANNCGGAADSSRIAADSAVAGASIVQGNIVVMNRIADRVKSTARVVSGLGARSDQIGEIVGTIEDIADQTNLLALNAAIEAARAGEQGRGFAVVADEVRALAERTSKATKEIGEMIKTIQSETREAVNSMEEGVREVEQGTMESSRSGEALRNILDQINAVNMQVSQIATAAEQQTATNNEITRNIQQVNDVIGESSDIAGELAASAGELSQVADGLHRLMGNFRYK